MPLAPLTTSGNRIVSAESGEPVLLRGINRSGLEYGFPLDAAARELLFNDLDTITRVWGASVVRIQFNQEWALEGEESGYLALLDSVIEFNAARGAYTILDLQWLDNRTVRGRSDGKPNFVPPLPDADSVALWQLLASRYRLRPEVLYDICNEPHDALEEDPLYPLFVTAEVWQPWAEALIEAIRAIHPEALILVAGVNWAYDHRRHPIPGVRNVVYSTHVYPSKGLEWDIYFGNLAATHPVFAGEWGGGADDLAWGRALAAYLAERSIGWCAWGWPDEPKLVDEKRNPTAFGGLVRSRLRPDSTT